MELRIASSNCNRNALPIIIQLTTIVCHIYTTSLDAILFVLLHQGKSWKKVGQFGKELTFFEQPIFPGGTIIPSVKDHKTLYLIAAFLPLNKELGALAELGELWVSYWKYVYLITLTHDYPIPIPEAMSTF